MPNAPAIPAADLALLRTAPHKNKLYLVIQQSQWRHPVSGNWTGYLWSGTVAAPVGVNDPIISLSVNSDNAIKLYDGMTVLIGSTAYGTWDRGIVRLHGDQTLGVGAETLHIAVSSDLRNVAANDYVVVLDEFRFWARYPKVTDGGGLTWYKDYGTFRDSLAGALGLLWTQLGVGAVAQRQASMPAVPIMGPHAVKFIDPGGAVTVDFNWTDSYAQAPGAAVNAWSAAGEDGGAGWVDNVVNPAAKNYPNVSGLAGYRVTLEVGSTVQDPIVEFRRGVRYVFTLRRPGQTQAGDPPNAEPIVDFSISGMQGSFDTGYWRASITVYDSQASEWCILPGALVIVFADDVYGSTTGSIGPLDNPGLTAPMDDRDNIVLIGRIADGTITTDSETGDVSFDIISLAQQASDRENYPVPIENDDNSEEWYGTPDLTVDRAAWFYWVWHTTGPLVADFYQVGGADGAIEIAAQDFLAGDIYQSAIGSFLQDRRFAHILFDRYERAICEVNVAIGGLPAAALFTRLDADGLEEVTVREVIETPCSLVEAGGVSYVAGVVTPFLSKAPGEVSKYLGRPTQSTHLAVANQADLDTLSGQLLAYLNNTYPDFTLKMAGNWRVFDIAPQAHLDCGVLTTKRRTFTNVNLIVRQVAFDYDPEAGALFTTVHAEMDTDGPDGVTVTIPASVPTDEPALVTTAPTGPPVAYRYMGHIFGSATSGVFYCDDYDLGVGTVWADLQNSELTTPGSLQIHDLRTHWWNGQESLFATTGCSLYEYAPLPPGSGKWYERQNKDVMVALAGGVVWEVNMDDVFMSPERPGWGWCSFHNREDHGGGTWTAQCVVAHTRDGWKTIHHSRVVATTTGFTRNFKHSALAVDPNSGGQIVYVAFASGPGHLSSYMYKSTDAGNSWAVVGTVATGHVDCRANSCWVSEANSNYVYWYNGADLRRSLNAGSTWTVLVAVVIGPIGTRVLVPPESEHICYFRDNHILNYWSEGDVAFTTVGSDFDPGGDRDLYGDDIYPRDGTTYIPGGCFYAGNNYGPAGDQCDLKINFGGLTCVEGNWPVLGGGDYPRCLAVQEDGLNRRGY